MILVAVPNIFLLLLAVLVYKICARPSYSSRRKRLLHQKRELLRKRLEEAQHKNDGSKTKLDEWKKKIAGLEKRVENLNGARDKMNINLQSLLQAEGQEKAIEGIQEFQVWLQNEKQWLEEATEAMRTILREDEDAWNEIEKDMEISRESLREIDEDWKAMERL